MNAYEKTERLLIRILQGVVIGYAIGVLAISAYCLWLFPKWL